MTDWPVVENSGTALGRARVAVLNATDKDEVDLDKWPHSLWMEGVDIFPDVASAIMDVKSRWQRSAETIRGYRINLGCNLCG